MYSQLSGYAESTLQLPSEVLQGNPNFEPMSFESIAPLPSNLEGIEAAASFAKGQTPFVAIVGPSGWGKTHLLNAAAGRITSARGGLNPHVVHACDWVYAHHKLDPHPPLLLDGAQEAMERSRSRLQLRLQLERRVKAGRPTMLTFTSSKATRQLRSFLPQTKMWLICSIAAPVSAERELVLRHMANAEGMVIADELRWLIAKRIGGNGRTLSGALNRLKLHGESWTGPEAVIQACGILDPFFSDNGYWDLRERIVEAVERLFAAAGTSFQRDLALYTMLRIALLPEDEVARYFEIEQAAAYQRACAFEKSLSKSNDLAAQLQNFLSFLVTDIQKA